MVLVALELKHKVRAFIPWSDVHGSDWARNDGGQVLSIVGEGGTIQLLTAGLVSEENVL